MDVRELTAVDREPATGLWTETGLIRPWNDPDADFDRAVDGSTSSILGAFDHDGLAATVMVGHDGHRGWVYYLAVRPTRRREGLGRRMMNEAERWLRDRGAVKLNLMIRHSNVEAVGFYQHLGYADANVTVLARWLRDPS
jgi:ribosomal protein S18 acetylase RimI-like enzyme